MMHRPPAHCWPDAQGCCASQAWVQLPPSERQTRSARLAQRRSSRLLRNACVQIVRVVTQAAWQ